MATLVIMGVESDPHVRRPMEALRERGHNITLIDYKKPVPVSLLYDESHEVRLSVGGEIVPPPILFWNRTKLRRGSDQYFDDYLEGETPAETRRRHAIAADLWSNFYRCAARVGNSKLVNAQQAVTEFWYKPFQHKIAARCGLNVPPSIVTSSKKDILDFLDIHGEVIVKSASTTLIPDLEGDEGRVMMTMQLTRDDIVAGIEGTMAEGPYFLQKKIDKAYELRIFVVGDKVNAFRIDSQSRELTQTDWRFGSGVLEFPPTTVSEGIRSSLVKLLKDVGLTYGSIDMIADRDGVHWYLECNPDGQWEFLESMDTNLSAQLAEHLSVMLSELDRETTVRE